MLLLGADSGVPKHAALNWRDQVDRKWFCEIATLGSRNGDDAWRSLDHALELVSHLCEPSVVVSPEHIPGALLHV